MATELAPEIVALRESLCEFIGESDLDDPYELAEAFINEIPDGQAWEALAEFLPDSVRVECVKLRQRARRAASRATSPRSARWDAATEHHLAGRIRAWRVYAGGTRKGLLRCTRGDLQRAAAYHFAKAESDRHTGEIYAQLDALMERHGATLVEELGIEAIATVIGAD